MPKEVLFGIDIHQNGDIYFSMNDKNWFNKIFKNNSYGVTVDLVSKDKYSCNRDNGTASGIPKGIFIPPTYKPDLAAGIDGLGEGSVYVKNGQGATRIKKQRA